MRKIEVDPARFPLLDSRHHACSLNRYPFQVIFRCDGEVIRVLAVSHAKRRVNYWSDRAES